MRYPTLTVHATQALAARRLVGEPVDVMGEMHMMGRGGELHLTPIDECADRISAAMERFAGQSDQRDRDSVEGFAAGELHIALGALPPEVLDDPGFWRFLTLGPLWSFVEWREESALGTKDWGHYRQYVDGTNPTECVLFRAFLRGRLTHERGSYPLASAIASGADFWRSHVLRVRTAGAPAVTRAFAASHATDRMSTDEVRSVARELNRMWSNIVLCTYDEHEAAELVAELREGEANQ